MKKIILLSISLATAVLSYSQCTPATDFGNEPFGVAPDTIVNFVDGEVDNFYIQQIDVKVPSNGEFANFPQITVDSAQVLNIGGLPDGLIFECAGNAVSECTYIGGTTGCALISGIPTEAGTFDLDITLLMYSAFGSIPYSVEGYEIFVDGSVGLEANDNLSFKMGNARPNPADALTTIYVDSKKSGRVGFLVYDLVGKEVFSKQVRLVLGNNKIDYATAELPEGVYIYRLDAFGESVTSRLVVLH